MIKSPDEKEIFYPSGEVMYRGEVKKNDYGHDKFHGKGVLFDQDGEVLYEGEFAEHMKHGNGTMYLKRKRIYEGEFKENKKQGSGILFHSDGSVQFEGSFDQDQMDGYGVLYYSLVELAPFDTFREQFPQLNRPLYEGYFVHGMKKGEGKLYYPSGLLQYEGDFMWHDMRGVGRLYFNTDEVTQELAEVGHCGLEYEGYFLDNMKNGKGKLYSREGLLLADGQFKNDDLMGKGKLYYPNGEVHYIGDLFAGKMHGRGEFYNEKGKLIYSGEFNNGERLRITPEVEHEIAKLQQQLDQLVGLPNAKKELHNLISFIKVQSLRVDHGLASFPITYHLVFTGNPGTGKTTVARIIGQIYKHLGVLSNGHFVETDRAGLVAGYVGQTALKVQEVVKKATGGVLFIDEAYALVNDPKDAFGQEAIGGLLKGMEDLRDDLVIIVAGYEEPMESFLNANPGFKSRFNHFVKFDNFTKSELYEIFASLCAQNDYVYEEEFAEKMKEQLGMIPVEEIPNFSNGRYIRNVFEKLVTIQSNRLVKQEKITRDELMHFEVVDIEQCIMENLFGRTY